MILTKFSYTDQYWDLQGLELNPVNLIVARNATGKSRTLLMLDLLVKIITQKRDLEFATSWDIEFQNSFGKTVRYEFVVKSDDLEFVVVKEKLAIDGELVLNRFPASALIKNKLTDKEDLIYPPVSKLVVHTNRDVKKHPFLEELINWAENSYGFKFGNINPYSKTFQQQEYNLLTKTDDIPLLFRALNAEQRVSVVKKLNDTGYNLLNINPENVGGFVVLYVTEQGIDYVLPHYQLAQGMYRALSTIILLEYLTSQKKPALVIIDDLCEGLDYDRAKKLGTLVFEQCLRSNIQLIATSNDSFLMDVVDIKYWNILNRTGETVIALNAKNHPKLFEDFKFTGLSNFDFFSSDFLSRGGLAS